jgi:hypothetical protein
MNPIPVIVFGPITLLGLMVKSDPDNYRSDFYRKCPDLNVSTLYYGIFIFFFGLFFTFDIELNYMMKSVKLSL